MNFEHRIRCKKIRLNFISFTVENFIPFLKNPNRTPDKCWDRCPSDQWKNFYDQESTLCYPIKIYLSETLEYFPVCEIGQNCR
jgi:hypothetical protein